MAVDPSVMKFVTRSPQYRPRILQFGIAPGAIQSETVTADSVANSDQADFVVLSNKDGQKEALWLDIDAAGTEPTADAYLEAEIKTMVSVSTGDTATDVGTAIAAAVTLPNVTVTDNLDGTFDVDQDLYGACDDAVVSNADGSGAGSISAAVNSQGADAVVGNGKFDATVIQETVGVFEVIFKQPFLRIPEVGVTSKSDNRVGRVSAADKFSVTIEMQDLSGGAAADGSFSLIVLGSDNADFI